MTDRARGRELFERELPDLLRTIPGRWVAFSSDGKIDEDDDEDQLIRRCRQGEKKIEDVFIGLVEVDDPRVDFGGNVFSMGR